MFNKLRSLLSLPGAKRTNLSATAPAHEDATVCPAFSIIDLTDQTADAALQSNYGLLAIDFWAEWCQPCDVMSAYVVMLAEHFAEQLLVAAVDVDENPTLSERFIVKGLPTLLFLRKDADGKLVEVDRVVGITPYEELVQRTEALLAPIVPNWNNAWLK